MAMRILVAAYPLYCVEINKLRYSMPPPLVTRVPQEQRHPELDYPAAAGRSRSLVVWQRASRSDLCVGAGAGRAHCHHVRNIMVNICRRGNNGSRAVLGALDSSKGSSSRK